MPSELFIYGDIGPSFGWDDDEGITDKDVLMALNDMAVDPTGLDVHINTLGGAVGDALAIMNTLRSYARKQATMYSDFKLRTVVDGFAYSSGTIIMLAGDERIMNPGSKAMSHNPMTMGFGNYKDFERLAAEYRGHASHMSNLFATATGKSAETWQTLMDDETFFTPEEAVKVNLATKAEKYAPITPIPQKEVGTTLRTSKSTNRATVPSAVYDGSREAFLALPTFGRGAYAKAVQLGRVRAEKNSTKRKIISAEQLRLELDCVIMVGEM